MPGPTPLIPTFRVHLPYTVAGEDHHMHLYCDALLASSVWSLVGWTISGNPLFDDAADDMAAVIGGLYDGSDTSFSDVLLENLGAGSWNPVASHSVAQPSAGGASQLAQTMTFIFRDDQFRKMKLISNENRHRNPFHFTSPTGLPAGVDAVRAEIVAPTAAEHLGNWMQSRGGGHAIGFVSVTSTDNKHLRRNRGYI